MILKIDARNPEPNLIDQAVGILKEGGIVAYPTETFYALGADFLNERAVKRIFEMKGRSFQSPIALIAGHENQLMQITDNIPETARNLIQAFWPGPLTLVFPATNRVHPLLTAGTGKIGVRISSHPVALALTAALGGPITATSANRSGQKECATAQEVYLQIGEDADMIIDSGATPGGKGSTFLDMTQAPPILLREGAVLRNNLSALLPLS